MALAVYHDHPLSVDFNLIFDSFADEKRRLNRAPDHSGRHRRSLRRKDFHIFGAHPHMDGLAASYSVRAVGASKNHAIRRALDSNGDLSGRIAGLHSAL